MQHVNFNIKYIIWHLAVEVMDEKMDSGMKRPDKTLGLQKGLDVS